MYAFLLLLLTSLVAVAQEEPKATIECAAVSSPYSTAAGKLRIQLPEFVVTLEASELVSVTHVCGESKTPLCSQGSILQGQAIWGSVGCEDPNTVRTPAAQFDINLTSKTGTFSCKAPAVFKKVALRLKDCALHQE